MKKHTPFVFGTFLTLIMLEVPCGNNTPNRFQQHRVRQAPPLLVFVELLFMNGFEWLCEDNAFAHLTPAWGDLTTHQRCEEGYLGPICALGQNIPKYSCAYVWCCTPGLASCFRNCGRHKHFTGKVAGRCCPGGTHRGRPPVLHLGRVLHSEGGCMALASFADKHEGESQMTLSHTVAHTLSERNPNPRTINTAHGAVHSPCRAPCTAPGTSSGTASCTAPANSHATPGGQSRAQPHPQPFPRPTCSHTALFPPDPGLQPQPHRHTPGHDRDGEIGREG